MARRTQIVVKMARLCVALLLCPLCLAGVHAVPLCESPPTPFHVRVVSHRWFFDPVLAQWRPVGEPSPVHRRGAAQVQTVEGQDIPISTASGWQLNPAIAWNSVRDAFLVVWEDGRNGTDLDIYGQRLSADGHALGSNFALVIGEYDQCAPLLFYNPADGGYLLLWHHHQPDNYALYGQRLSATGVAQGASFRIPLPNEGQPWIPGAAYNDISNEFLVVWEDTVTGDFIAQRIASDGALLGDAITVSTRSRLQWAPPCVAFNNVWGEYLVTWDDVASGDIYGQVVAADGTLRGENLAICTAPGQQFVSAVIYNSDRDKYLVLWTDERDLATRGSDVYGQYVAGGGTLMGEELLISGAPQWQRNPVGIYDHAHAEYLIVWWDGRNADTASDIYGQRVSTEGPLFGGNVPIAVKVSDQVYPRLAYGEGNDAYAIVWQEWLAVDRQDDEADIYGALYTPQRFSVWFPLAVQGWLPADSHSNSPAP